PANAEIADVAPGDVVHAHDLDGSEDLRAIGEAALREGSVAVVTLAAGVGSRWTEGAGVVKAINPFVRLAGAHRTFLEIHLAKSRR
ncbi:MAG TPA: hypothetical protein PLC98_18840, partial [Anaerolineales bacterium]|nr:hypothetical protein [Anaerolineales bacterium]